MNDKNLIQFEPGTDRTILNAKKGRNEERRS